MRPLHSESHLVERIGWLRAAVLGANDGIISTASLILGVAAAAAAKPSKEDYDKRIDCDKGEGWNDETRHPREKLLKE